MRIATLILAFVVGVPALGAAQDWAEYTSIQDGFRVDFPGTPTITNTTWQSQLDYVLPGRIYTVQKGKERYSMTVIDYHPLEQQGIDRAAKCPEGNAQCRQNAGIMQTLNLTAMQHIKSKTGDRWSCGNHGFQLLFKIQTPARRYRYAVPAQLMTKRPQYGARSLDFFLCRTRATEDKQINGEGFIRQATNQFCLFDNCQRWQ